ncbi:MAG: hypothetical protein HZA60_05100 [Deltaproteobacteria bacterium]|nr:hypothetical protein [Deltaproteobacteria bacterium]
MAIQMYVPFSAMPREAAGRLLAAGEEAEKKGNDVEALRAYNYLRSGLLATRHIWQPMPEMTRAAEDRLTSLAPPAERDRQAALLRVRHGTAAAGIPLILVGTLGWPVSMAYLLREWKRGGNIWRWQRFLLPVVFLLSLISGALVS